ncbi:hemerythrin family protein [Thermosulfuriphilus ammonigenes]|uniref:Hemerythrin family protein n=1 Tax=Thermosulfuriphilus ammonigenes TaxID=1936021 RepID=A0A6G7PTS3_9BACT|nr:bacteriohemerythrin [Thermosulfuriphilus ammonigenes]MBA2848788.1 hemerythrin [Thermosulfuriphilus ammonigenes]QIJ71084.1 hemerythrin family protein [Thermosulfuriphilus ammonigenes]
MEKLVSWNDAFSVGVKCIDDQHKQLVKIINCVQRVKNIEKDRKKTITVLNCLIRYTDTHFITEEKLMKEYDYPEYKEHQEEHEKLLMDIFNIHSLYEKGDITSNCLMVFLKDWLVCHILDTDRRCGLFLKAKGVS